MARVAELLGTPLMPWQRQVADVALEINPATGLFAYRTVIVTVPRQSGKTTLVLSTGVHRCTIGRHLVAYAAQTGADARTKLLEDQEPMLHDTVFGSAYRPVRSNGREHLRWRNGSRYRLLAATKTAGHGLSALDLAFLDEAFAHEDDRLEQACRPAMLTRPNAQLWVISTMGDDTSAFLDAKIELGRRAVADGRREGVAYFEWSAAEDASPHDEETWWSCMPALGRSVCIQTVRSDYETMKLPEFVRAYLNRKTTTRQWVIDPEAWSAAALSPDSGMADAIAHLVVPELVAYGLDVDPDRSWAAVSASTMVDDRVLVSVGRHDPGTDWCAAEISRLLARPRAACVVIDAGGPAASIVPALRKAGLDVVGASAWDRRERGKVVLVAARDLAAAAGGFYDDATTGRLAHLGQPALGAAVGAATKRWSQDAWLWARKNDATVSIAPLVSATLARWGLVEAASVPSTSWTFY